MLITISLIYMILNTYGIGSVI